MTTDTRTITFFVPGVPISQGSKTRTQYGMRESNETKLKPWRASIVACAPDLEQPLTGAVGVEASFIFPRPKTHFRTGRHSDELKQDAPLYHVFSPDLDKLQRALGDALAGVVIASDAQIARWICVKFYGGRPGAFVSISTLVDSVPL